MANRSRYSREYRAAVATQVAELRAAGKRSCITAVAEQLGLPLGTVSGWYHEFGPPEPNPTPTEEPHAPEQRLPLLGLAHHARCGTPLRPGQGPDGRPAYACPRCRPQLVLDAEQVHQHAVAAVTRQAPRLGRISPTRLPGLLASLRVNDQCRTLKLTWRIHGSLP